MPPEATPEGLRQAQFKTTLRGLDRAEVEAVLDAAAARLEQLEAERRRLAAKLEEGPPVPDLSSEFETVGREVTAILQAAREAAETMRERASVDSARWRSEAMEEAEAARRDAAADAEALRRDAWVTSTELLEQTTAAADAMRANAKRDVLTIMGEAEREAHRLTSAARREAEDMVRNASMDAEKSVADATKRRDEIIDGANRAAAAAQERTRALEQRRDELLEELENVRSTLTRLESSLEERREALDFTAPAESTSVKVVHPPAEAKQHWALGETVRVVPPGQREPDTFDAEGYPEDMTIESGREPETVSATAAGSPPVAEPEPETTPEPEAASEPELEAASEPERESEPEPVAASEPEPEDEARPEPEPVTAEPSSDELAALFASLRGGDEAEDGSDMATDEVAEEDPGSSGQARAAPVDGIDWIEVRENRLLPITNRALRG